MMPRTSATLVCALTLAVGAHVAKCDDANTVGHRAAVEKLRALGADVGEFRFGRASSTTVFFNYCDDVDDTTLKLLDSLDDLKSVGFQGTNISNDGLAVLEDLPHLERFSIGKKTKLDSRCLEYIRRLERLQCLNVEIEVDDKAFAALESLTDLRDLGFVNAKFTDRSLQTIAKFSKLERLTIAFCSEISDDGLKSLQSLPLLTSVVLHGSDISDAGISHLAKIPNLEGLNFRLTKVTDESVEQLTKMPRLRHVVVGDTLSIQGMEALSQALPKCRIIR